MTVTKRKIWDTKGDEKRTAVQGMFAEIAPTYDRVNGLMSMSLHHRWRSFAVSLLQLKPGESALDVCCGTGDFIVPLVKAVGTSGSVFGIDFCEPMLKIAREKLPTTPLSLGDACNLPVRSESFDAVSVGWGIRNVANIDGAHMELVRVLKKGGRFLSLDMALPRNPVMRAISNIACGTLLPKLGALFGKSQAYTYLPKSTQSFMTRQQLKESMEQAGLKNVQQKDLFFGNICVHWGTKS